MHPEIRPFRATDDVAHLGGRHVLDADEPRRRRTIVAVLDGRCVGAGSLTWSTRHPDLVGADITVAPDARRHGIGTLLLRQLEALADLPLLFNIELSDARHFLKARGYAVATESRTRRVATAALQPWLAAVRLPILDVSISPLPFMSADVERLYDEIYGDRHQWAGRYTPPPNAPWIDFCGPMIDATLAVAIAGGRLVGVTSLHRGPFNDGAAAFLPPTGVIGPLSRRARVHVLQALLVTTLTAAQARGIDSITYEIDTDYWELAEISAAWPDPVLVDQREAWKRGVGT